MKVKASELKSIIKEAINNVINNPLQELESKVEEASTETRNEIESLTNKLHQFEKIVPTVQSLYTEISNRMPIVRTFVNYSTRLEMVLKEPIPYSEDVDDFVDEMNSAVEDMLKEAIRVDFAFENNGNNGMVSGFYIDVELDSVQGWY